MHDLGRTLVHVAGVALCAASDCVISHNRITRTPRYAIQVDSFYPGARPDGSSLISRAS